MCDIVMKGGITSGVVYPGAILSLAPTYRFRSIGGTSAGAIAAAIVSAAEHARRGANHVGFEEVIANLPERLGDAVGGKPFMLQLFQADKPTRPLFTAAVRFMSPHGKVLGPLGLLVAFRRSALAAGAVGVSSVLLCTVGDLDAALGVAGVSASVAIFAAGTVAETRRALRAIAANDFGFCRLGPGVGSADKPALTSWLHEQIQAAAGRTASAAPLTFADLWGVDPATGPASADEARFAALRTLSHDANERRVDLHMITTDLTQGRPVRLPILYDRHAPELEDDADQLLFDRLELRRFFPASVVEHLVRCSEPLDADVRALESTLFHPEELETALRGDDWANERARPRLLRLPIGPDLPVVVATRMSLSFPILISGVPLWRLDRSGGTPRIRRVIFSDGGITSNFPIHFFDSPLPRWPTFGLNLTTPEPGPLPDPDDAEKWVDPPPAPGAVVADGMREITDLVSFGGAVADAAQNWRDNSQARLPGFRDRIAHIKLARREGGLNLAMQDGAIERLNERGRVAGAHLRRLFAGADGRTGPIPHWEDHRFARYRVTMAVMQRLLRSYRRGYTTPAPGDDVTAPYAERLARGETVGPFEFGAHERLEAATATSDAYAALADEPGRGLLDDENVPRPPATMRAVPPA